MGHWTETISVGEMRSRVSKALKASKGLIDRDTRNKAMGGLTGLIYEIKILKRKIKELEERLKIES